HINQKALKIIRSLVQQGKRAAAFNGAQHNDIIPNRGEEDRSFGKILRNELGINYIEVDIYLPDLITSGNEKWLRLKDWQELVPKQGVNLVTFNNKRYILILSKSKARIIPKIPKKAPKCP
ncbi:unnamed protein product, partial [marine sediment metagenome]